MKSLEIVVLENKNISEESVQKKNKTNRWGIVIFWSYVLLIMFYLHYRQSGIDKYRSTFKGETIGFATMYKHASRITYIKYYFYVNERIASKMEVSGGNEDLLDKFYKVKYDLNNPNENCIFLEKELKPDSISLVNAGFKKIKYYVYDGGVTCKYIEKSKWK